MLQVFIPALLLFTMLFSFAVHAEHYNVVKGDITSIAEQDCNFCQQNIDNIDNDVEVFQQIAFYYSPYVPQIYSINFYSNNALTPPLRAPPVHS